MIVLVSSISIILVCGLLLIGEMRRNRIKQTAGHNFKSLRVNLRSMAWLTSLIALCLSIIAYGWFYPRALFLPIMPNPVIITPAYLQSYNVSCGVLIWLIFRITVGRNQGGLKSVISLLAIAGSVLAVVLISNREAAIVIEEVQRHVSTLANSGSKSNSDVPRARGEFGEIERFFKGRLSQMASLATDYERELAGIGWERILDPEDLGRDPTLMIRSSIVKDAKSLVAKYRDSTYDLCENSKRAVSSLPISEWAKKYMVNELRQVVEEMHVGLDERWSWEAQIISVVEEVVAWLSSSDLIWAVENGALVFTNENDLSRFNSYMNELDKLISQQGGRN